VVRGDEVDPERVRALAAARRRAYREGGTLIVPNPALPLVRGHESTSQGVLDDRRPVLGCVTAVLAIVYVAVLLEAAVAARSDLVLTLRVLLVAAVLAVPACVLWLYRLTRTRRSLPVQVALPWQDVVEGMRLGSAEPDNPAWPLARTCAVEVQADVRAAQKEILRTAARKRSVLAAVPQQHLPSPELLDRIHTAAAEVYATSEAWREVQARRPRSLRTSALDRVPGIVGPTAEEASTASDAAADAAATALGLGDHDVDFHHYARRRAGMYRRSAGDDVRCQDPRDPLADASYRTERARRRSRWAFRVFGAAVAVTALLVLVEAYPASVVPAAVALLASVAASRFLVGDASWTTAPMPPGHAMAWTDYLDAVRVADSGSLPVTTVEAIRGCEQRVRALLVELTSAGASPAESEELEGELYRLCSEVWALVGQARAEERALPD